jgi:hypothetical protein
MFWGVVWGFYEILWGFMLIEWALFMGILWFNLVFLVDD